MQTPIFELRQVPGCQLCVRTFINGLAQELQYPGKPGAVWHEGNTASAVDFPRLSAP
jgi:hypothetical protein